MAETIRLGDLAITLTRKDVKHVHLSVHPPDGRVTLVAPRSSRPDVARAYALSKLGWIRSQQAKLFAQARETPRQFIERESHYLWGRRYLMSVVERDAKPNVRLSHRRITVLVVEPTHSERFVALMDRHYPTWRTARAELNELPLAAEHRNASATR